MAKKKNSNSPVIASVFVGIVLGALGTTFFSSDPSEVSQKENTNSSVQENQNDNTNQVEEFGVGGGPTPELNENEENGEGEPNDSTAAVNENTAAKEKENTAEQENSSEENSEIEEGTISDTAGQQGIEFSYASLTQPQVEKLSDTVTIYRFGSENSFSALTGAAQESALNSIIVQDEESIQIDGKNATYIEGLSIQDGSKESYVIVYTDTGILLAQGTEEFLSSLQTDLSL